jgi:hypothetical protein
MSDNAMGSGTVTGVTRSQFGVHVFIRTTRNGETTDSTAFFGNDIYEDTDGIYEYFQSIIGREYRDGQEVNQAFDATFTGNASEGGSSIFDDMQMGPDGRFYEPTFAERFEVLQFDINNGRGSWPVAGAGSDFFF